MRSNRVGLLQVLAVGGMLTAAAPLAAADSAVTAATPVMAMPGQTVDNTYTIGAATVRVKLMNGAAFLVVSKGAVNVAYGDGTALTTVPEGTAVKIDGFMGANAMVTLNLVAGKALATLGGGVEFAVTSNGKGAKLTLAQANGMAPATLEPGATATVAAPFTTFNAGQSIALKPNQLGKATAGENTVYALGTASGLAVTTKSASASLKGGGNDQLVLSKDAVLTVNNGGLAVSATAISLTGAGLQLVSTAGTIAVIHDGKSMPFATGRTIGGPAPAPAPTPVGNTEQKGKVSVTQEPISDEDAKILEALQ